ncbi:DUF445 domain-containing protein [Alkalicoccobacillus murimartini]|uniref:Uncharacterized membrane protein YheB (UPF0754 family) n=1 Tax=Alkalicoccobacillus murimartini TaxID=171685 RepID=A0ABT9YC49_9BACI|nr:DUF445 family protein [Alkalicoccobacillus murimartini]MDQ0205301.1 uncharacterized membrane protein YheB (UPF0754 family) [Alkalicoccobacillus murimartini]
MDPWLLVVFMVVVGAALGGLTNALAIRMLFKPYRAYYIGSWRLPFTPGLIPKRHKEIAVQLGNMVGTYLLTAEGLEKQIKQSSFASGVTSWMEEEVKKVMQSEQTLNDFVEENFGISNLQQSLHHRTNSIIKSGIERFIEANEHKTVGEILPLPLSERIETYIPDLSQGVLDKAVEYFESAEGKEKLSGMIEEFLDHKGKLGSMIQMFMGNERLVDKVQPEILRFLRNDRTNQLLSELIEKEWVKGKDMPFHQIKRFINQEKVTHFLSQLVKDKAPVLRSMDAPLTSWVQSYEDRMFTTWIPNAVQFIVEVAAKRIGRLLEAFHIEQIISEQVQSFSIKHLEDLVMSVAAKELKLITYLGALIGGIVGLFQGFFVLLINGF